MIKTVAPILHRMALLSAATAIVSPAVAFAQAPNTPRGPAAPASITESAHGQIDPAKSNDQNGGGTPEIIVTGTLLRGGAPAGTNSIALSQKAVQATGASTTAQLLQTIPQLGSFNSLQFPGGGFNQITTNRPNLRNLPGFTTSGGSSTLVLVDGHRVVGAGIQTTTPDPDIVPPGMIERVEIVPDGGSSIYGSDAVAGVVNFITRKNFDGLEENARYGFADNYRTFDANVTAGRSWGSGSAYISFNHSEHDAIYGRDRDFVKEYPTTMAGVPFPVTSIQCSPGNVQDYLAGGTIYALPFGPATGIANSANQCDASNAVTIYPKENRNSFFGGVSQELTSTITLDVKGFFTERHMFQDLGPNRVTQLVGPAAFGLTPSPFQADHADAGLIQQVSFAFGDSHQNINLKTWGITPTLTANLGGSWELRALGSYGGSVTTAHTTQYNQNAIPTAIAAGVFNPYDPASTPDGINDVTDFETFGHTRQQLLNARLVADGNLLTLPGGSVKLAGGTEYIRETFISQQGGAVPGTQDTGFAGLYSATGDVIIPSVAALPIVHLRRNVKAVFGELQVPVFGNGNARPGMKELSLSVSARYDNYSDFGSTFNPKFGITYRPLDWIKIRGAWGKSFVAPSLADNAAASVTSFSWVQGLSFLLPPANLVANGTYPAPGAGQYVGVVLGNSSGLKPQKATTWSLGFDMQPPIVPYLNLSLTYFNIKYNGVIATAPFTDQSQFWNYFGSAIAVHPTQAQIDSYLAQSGVVAGGACSPQPSCVYAILDARKKNLGDFKLDGLDMSASYSHPTGFGSINLAINADYELDRKQSPIAGAPYVDQIANPSFSRFRMSASAGAQIGHLTAQATLNHTGGYKLGAPVGVDSQTKVSSFNVVNLFFQYGLSGTGFLKDMALTLNVDNVFDQRPPVYT